jgi:hypothetical protein
MELDLFFQMLDRKNPWVRAFTADAYLLGFIAFAIPSIQVFAKVVAVLTRSSF